MAVPLCLLASIDHIRYGLNIFCLVRRDLLDAFGIPANVVPLGHVILFAGSAVGDAHTLRWGFLLVVVGHGEGWTQGGGVEGFYSTLVGILGL